MIDLVNKAKKESGDMMIIGSPLLPQRQFDIACFMIGKKKVSAGEISKSLGIESGQVSVFMNTMFNKKVVSRSPKIGGGGKPIFLYTLQVSEFTLKTSGKGIKRETS